MLTLPVSLFRSESLGFGKPKKVGMPKRSRKAVAVAEDVPVTEDVAGVAAEPPSSPPHEAWWDLPPLAPDVVIEQEKFMAKRRSLLAAHDAAAEEFNTIAFSVQYLPSETFLSAIKDAYHTWKRAGAELERFCEEDLGPPCKSCMGSEIKCCCTRGRCKVCNGSVPAVPGMKSLFWPGMCICLVWGVTTIGVSTRDLAALRRRIKGFEL